MLELIWGVKKREIGRIVAKWAPKWRYMAKVFCCFEINENIIRKSQTPGMENRFGCPIACVVDGTVYDTEQPRKRSALSRLMYNDKNKHQGGQVVTWTLPDGTVVLCSAAFCGRVSEKHTVRIYRRWLEMFPRGFGRLIDRGFVHCTQYYPNLNKGFSPAFLDKKTKDLMRSQIISAREQSRHRCELLCVGGHSCCLSCLCLFLVSYVSFVWLVCCPLATTGTHARWLTTA